MRISAALSLNIMAILGWCPGGLRIIYLFLRHITLIFLYLPEPSSYLPGAQAVDIFGSLSKCWAGIGQTAPLHTMLKLH